MSIHKDILFMTEELTRRELGVLACCRFGSILYCVHDVLCRASSCLSERDVSLEFGLKDGKESWVCSVQVQKQ